MVSCVRSVLVEPRELTKVARQKKIKMPLPGGRKRSNRQQMSILSWEDMSQGLRMLEFSLRRIKDKQTFKGFKFLNK